MPIRDWDNSLDLGIKEMNDDHREILDYINRIYDRDRAGASKMEILGLLKDLSIFTMRHFKREEELMKSFDYADYKPHCELHKHLLSQLSRFTNEYAEGTEKIPPSLLIFLQRWLTTHIMNIDKKYAAVYAKRSA